MIKRRHFAITFFLFALSTLTSCGLIKELESEKNTTVYENPSEDKTTLKIISWNLYNFGKSKNQEEINYIAQQLKHYDVVAIQEISTSLYGIRAVGKLADELNRMGAKWEYKISDPTTGKGKERYAYLWKPSKMTLKKSWLEENLEKKIDREPFMARFELKKEKQTMLIASFHAVPTSKDPEHEIVLLEDIPDRYRTDNLMILGDFNLSEKHEAFNGLKERSFATVIKNQKTSLRLKPQKGNPLNKEYDNIFFEQRGFDLVRGGVIHFYKDFPSLKKARYISDHLPVWTEIRIKQ